MISTGIPTVDIILRGGLHSGVIDLYGESGTGRTAFGASLFRQASLEGRPSLLVCAGYLEKEFLSSAGVPSTQPVMTVNSWLELGRVLPEILVRMGSLLVVLDSATALEGSVDAQLTTAEVTLREQACIRADALKAIRTAAKASDGVVVLVSEGRACIGSAGIRSALGVSCAEYIDTALKFSQIESHVEYGRLAYKRVAISVVRNKHAPPTGEAVVHVFPDGIHKHYEQLKLLIQTKKVESRGSYWVFPKTGIMLGPGYDKAAKQLEEYDTGNRTDRQEG